MGRTIWIEGCAWVPALVRWAEKCSLARAADASTADIVLALAVDADALPSPSGWTPAASQLRERYRLEVAHDAPLRITATVADVSAVRLVLNAVRRGLQHGDWPDHGVQMPRFGIRGVIEGFYGPPWTHEERLDMLEFLADHDFTLLVLAPKDEAAQRTDWRTPLDESAQQRLAEIVESSDRCGVAVGCCVSPGLSIRYSDARDIDLLVRRFEQFRTLGVRSLGLLLDDIPGDLQHDEDRAAFPSLATAHAALANEVTRRLWEVDPGLHLMVCPLVYHGTGDEEYLVTLGQALHPRVDVFWTGREICSRRLDLLDAATFARSTWRPPLYWDNYPVNDVAMVGELHIGPLRGRDPHLYRLSAGLVSNAMDRAEASKIPLATIGDYLRDPEGYDPDRSWDRAIHEVAGAQDHEAFRRFAETVLVSCLADGDAPTLSRVLGQVGFALGHGDREGASRLLRAHAAEIDLTAGQLRRADVANPRLQEQSAPWVEAYAEGASALRTAADVVDGLTAPTALADFRHSRRPRVFGDALAMFSEEIVEGVIPLDLGEEPA